MKHIVMTSGGMGSFIALDFVRLEYGAENCLALFADTKIEDGDLYRFLREIIDYTGVELARIADGRNPWEVFRDVGFVGNTRVDPCSLHLKRRLCDSFVTGNFLPDACTVHIGIDASEIHRYLNLVPRKLPYVYRAPLVERGIIWSKKQQAKYCLERGIAPPHLYDLGFQHNNCGGFCVKAGLAQFKLLLEKLPERYDYHVQEERKTREAVPNARPFLRWSIEGVTHYVWLEQYREYLLSGGDEIDEFDWGGCGCALE